MVKTKGSLKQGLSGMYNYRLLIGDSLAIEPTGCNAAGLPLFRMTVTGWQEVVSKCKLLTVYCQTYGSITSIPLDGERDSKVDGIEGWVAKSN